jgi:hypothetical protein
MEITTVRFDIKYSMLCKRPAGMTETSVAEPELEPEPVEQQLFARAGAKDFWPGSGSGAGFIIFYKMLQTPLIFHTKV